MAAVAQVQEEQVRSYHTKERMSVGKELIEDPQSFRPCSCTWLLTEI